MLIMSMAISAYTITSPLRISNISIPKIEKVEVKLSQSFWDNHFRENPIRINFSKIDLSSINL